MSESTVAAPVAVESSAPAPTATPEAPQVSSGQPSAPTQPVERTGPLTRREAQQSVAAKARATYEAHQQARAVAETAGATVGGGQTGTQPAAAQPMIDATGRAHDPSNGQFTTLPAADAAVGTEPAAVTPQPGISANQPAAYQPQEIRIPLPDGHSLREQGREYLVATSPEQERDIRALLNSDTRRREVETARREAQQAREEALQLRAWVEAQQQWQSQALSDGVLETYAHLKEVDEAVAESYLAGERLKLQADAEQRYAQATEAEQQAATVDVANRFLNEVYTEISSSPTVPAEVLRHPKFTAAWWDARRSYGYEVEQQGADEPSRERFLQHLETAVIRQPELRSVLENIQRQQSQAVEAQRQQEAARQADLERIRVETERRIREEAAKAERDRLLAAQTPLNPVAQLPGRSDLLSTQATPVDTAKVPLHDLRRNMRDDVRQLARQSFAR